MDRYGANSHYPNIFTSFSISLISYITSEFGGIQFINFNNTQTVNIIASNQKVQSAVV